MSEGGWGHQEQSRGVVAGWGRLMNVTTSLMDSWVIGWAGKTRVIQFGIILFLIYYLLDDFTNFSYYFHGYFYPAFWLYNQNEKIRIIQICDEYLFWNKNFDISDVKFTKVIIVNYTIIHVDIFAFEANNSENEKLIFHLCEIESTVAVLGNITFSNNPYIEKELSCYITPFLKDVCFSNVTIQTILHKIIMMLSYCLQIFMSYERPSPLNNLSHIFFFQNGALFVGKKLENSQTLYTYIVNDALLPSIWKCYMKVCSVFTLYK